MRRKVIGETRSVSFPEFEAVFMRDSALAENDVPRCVMEN